MWALVKDKRLVKYPYTRRDLKNDHPTVSFPAVMDKTLLKEFDVQEVTIDNTIPPHDHRVESVVGDTVPTYTTRGWVLGMSVRPKPLEEIHTENRAAATKAKERRNKDLDQVDRELFRDYLEEGKPIPTSFKEYKQALRDITKQDGFPMSIQWPEKPND